jgi:hypothetical protein
MTQAQIRARIVSLAKFYSANGARVHYKQIRPMPLKGSLPLTTDCSGFATMLCKLAGALDPNGTHFDGTGFTGTMLRHLARIPQAKALPGDLIVFGPGTGDHVVILMESGHFSDPLVCSHGQEKGPLILRLSEEARHQSRPVQFLRITFPVVHTPPPVPRPVSDVLNSSEVATAKRVAQSGGGGAQNRMD